MFRWNIASNRYAAVDSCARLDGPAINLRAGNVFDLGPPPVSRCRFRPAARGWRVCEGRVSSLSWNKFRPPFPTLIYWRRPIRSREFLRIFFFTVQKTTKIGGQFFFFFYHRVKLASTNRLINGNVHPIRSKRRTYLRWWRNELLLRR